MRMLSSSIPCPRCRRDSVLTIFFGPHGPDVSEAEFSFSCPEGHEVDRSDLLAAWNIGRGVQAAAG